MINNLKVQKGINFFLIIFALVLTGLSGQAQNQLDENFKKNACKYYDIIYQVPENYHGIVVESSYSANNKNLQGAMDHSLKNQQDDIVVTFSLMTTKPDNTPRGIRIREVFGDPARINLEAIEYEADTTLSKIIYVDTLQLKKVNADRGVIYNLKIINKYLKVYNRCKKIGLYKDNMGRVEILFFYNKGDDVLVDKEIEKTWGMLRFKS